MSVDERSRHDLHDALEQAIGREPADTLMAYLPPGAWHHLATKDDIERLDARVEAAEQRVLATLRGEMVHQTRTMVFATSSAVLTVGGLAFAAARLG